jgi:hypothetical protein
VVVPVSAANPVSTGPSSSASPYVVPLAPGVTTRSILTVGDAVDGYRLVGIPDGMGALEDGGQFRLFVNHELRPDRGIGRAHGGTGGAFVSEWEVKSSTLRVESGQDLIDTVYFWNGTGYETRSGAAANLNRFCSGDLPEKSAFWDPRSRSGYNGRIFMNGEEAGDEGRAFANIVTGKDQGTSYELPYLGKFSWENSVAAPGAGRTTVVIGLDDSTPGQVYVYVGEKQREGSALERAGLTGGSLWGVKVPGIALESRETGVGGASVAFDLHNFGDVSDVTGAELQAESVDQAVTEFLRPEDGHWDPNNPNDFYFVTTDRFETTTQVGNSRLYRLRFEDVSNPALGGTLDMLLDGTEGPQMMDNMTIDTVGNVLIQEDPGGQDYLARIWSYDIAADTVTAIAQHDPARFTPGRPDFLTRDEESSGIIDAAGILGPGWFIANVQAHYSIGDTELVEGGQIFALYNPASDWTR